MGVPLRDRRPLPGSPENRRGLAGKDCRRRAGVLCRSRLWASRAPLEVRGDSLGRTARSWSPKGAGWAGPKCLCTAPVPSLARPSASGCCLKIVAVSRHERFVRILNQSLEETADLGGCMLQQLVRDFPVATYRFPAGMLLAPRHHITVRPAPAARAAPGPAPPPLTRRPAVRRCGVRGPPPLRSSRPLSWVGSPSTSTPAEAALLSS